MFLPWILSTTIMQDYQFKYILRSFCIFYAESVLFSAPILHMIEWRSSRKEFLFVQLFFKSDNISPTTFRGHAWNCGAYRATLPFLLDFFVYIHMTNASLLSGKTELCERHRRNIFSQELHGSRVLKIWWFTRWFDTLWYQDNVC